VDHGLGAGGQGLVVSGEAPVQHDPTNTSLDNPAPFDNVEAANSGVSVDDFDVDSEAGAVLDDGVLEAGVDPALGDGRVGLLGLVEELDSDGVLGSGDLWITEYVIDYDGKPAASTISIMEFHDGKVVHETQYFADPFVPPSWRAKWVEAMPQL
jgi:hypothetical protein